jgi:hypothetical protein
MEKTVQAVYEDGVLRPLEPVPLENQQEVTVTISDEGDIPRDHPLVASPEEWAGAAGDPISLLHRDEHQVKVADITRLYHQDKRNLDLLRRTLAVEALPEAWREYFLQRLTQLAGSASSSEA